MYKPVQRAEREKAQTYPARSRKFIAAVQQRLFARVTAFGSRWHPETKDASVKTMYRQGDSTQTRTDRLLATARIKVPAVEKRSQNRVEHDRQLSWHRERSEKGQNRTLTGDDGDVSFYERCRASRMHSQYLEPIQVPSNNRCVAARTCGVFEEVRLVKIQVQI